MRERSRSPEHDRRSVQDAAEPAAPALDRAGIGNRAIGGLFGHELAFESDNALRALADSGPPPLGNHSMGRLVQAKLAIGRPDDPAEREADQVAQRAVRTPAELGPPAVRPTSSASGAGLAVAPDDVERAVAGGGHPLDAGTRSTMEQRLGADFSGVRVHPNSPAPQRLGAVAFTAGTDIVFAPSAYDAASPDGQRLLAHELAHVVQQGTGAAGSIQRQPEEAAQGAAPAAGAAPNAEQVRIMAYQATVLQRVPPISESDQRALATVMSDMPVYQQLTERDRLRGELEQLQGWITDLEHRNAALARGEELSGGTGASPDEMAGYRARAAQLTARIDELTAQIAPQLAALGTDEAHLRQRVEQEFPEIWERRAESIVLSMLAENEAAARREQARYGGNMSSIDIDGLLRADAFLKGLADAIKTMEAQRQQANEVVRPGGESLPGGVPEGSDEAYRTIATTTARIGELQQQLQAERNALGVTFPILLSKDYAPGALQNLPEGQLQQITGAWTGDVLDNIDKTRKAIADGTLKVWELRDVPELTWRSLGLPADGPLGQVLERYDQRDGRGCGGRGGGRDRLRRRPRAGAARPGCRQVPRRDRRRIGLPRPGAGPHLHQRTRTPADHHGPGRHRHGPRRRDRVRSQHVRDGTGARRRGPPGEHLAADAPPGAVPARAARRVRAGGERQDAGDGGRRAQQAGHNSEPGPAGSAPATVRRAPPERRRGPADRRTAADGQHHPARGARPGPRRLQQRAGRPVAAHAPGSRPAAHRAGAPASRRRRQRRPGAAGQHPDRQRYPVRAAGRRAPHPPVRRPVAVQRPGEPDRHRRAPERAVHGGAAAARVRVADQRHRRFRGPLRAQRSGTGFLPGRTTVRSRFSCEDRPVRGNLSAAAAVIALLAALVGAVYAGVRLRARRGIATALQRATYDVLHVAALAAEPLRAGLTDAAGAKAVRHLRTLTGAVGFAITATGRVLAFDGAGEHHADQLTAAAARADTAGRPAVLGGSDLACDMVDCPVRGAVVVPLQSGEAALVALSNGPVAPGLVQATLETGRWVSAQLALAELESSRARLARAEVRALRAQISPHFIYNALTAIASFVRTDPELARELILEFAEFTRYSFRAH